MKTVFACFLLKIPLFYFIYFIMRSNKFQARHRVNDSIYSSFKNTVLFPLALFAITIFEILWQNYEFTLDFFKVYDIIFLEKLGFIFKSLGLTSPFSNF